MKGKTAAEVVGREDVKAIVLAYRGNGGDMSYEQIEKVFGLRQSNGMTAYRIIKRAAKEASKEAEKDRSEYEVRMDPPEEPTSPEDPVEKEESIVDIMLSARAWQKMA